METRKAITERHDAWRAHPWRARAIRVAVALGSPILALIGAWTLAQALPAPSGMLAMLGWWLVVSIFGTGLLVVIDRFLKRLLPLAALLEISLVFPDRAPKRFKAAMRSGSARQLERRMDEVRAGATSLPPAEAAEAIIAFAADLNRHERLTRGHVERVRAYAELIGSEMGLSEDEANKLRWASLLHDVGKLAVPAEILSKPGKPTDDEWAVLKTHPAEGALLLAPLADWLGTWADAAGQHHERWDGTGYPAGLSGEEISRSARIVAVADAFDVITAARSYKTPMSAEEGRAEIVRHSGTQFDPETVRALLGVSIGDLRKVIGPLSWMQQAPALDRLARIPGAASSAVAAASLLVVLAGAALGLHGTPANAATARRASPGHHSAPANARSPRPAKGAGSPTSPSGGPGTTATAGSPPTTLPGSTIADPAAGPTTTVSPGDTTVPSTLPTDPGAPGSTAPPTTTPPVGGSGPPSARSLQATISAGRSLSLTLANLGTTPAGGPLHLVHVSGAAHGYVTPQGDTATYAPAAGFIGSDSYTYTLADRTGATASATISITVSPPGPPSAGNDSFTMPANFYGIISFPAPGLLVNDHDPDGYPLTADPSLVLAPHLGVVHLNADGSFTYQRTSHNPGTDTFRYRVSNGYATATAAVTVTLP